MANHWWRSRGWPSLHVRLRRGEGNHLEGAIRPPEALSGLPQRAYLAQGAPSGCARRWRWSWATTRLSIADIGSGPAQCRRPARASVVLVRSGRLAVQLGGHVHVLATHVALPPALISGQLLDHISAPARPRCPVVQWSAWVA